MPMRTGTCMPLDSPGAWVRVPSATPRLRSIRSHIDPTSTQNQRLGRSFVSGGFLPTHGSAANPGEHLGERTAVFLPIRSLFPMLTDKQCKNGLCTEGRVRVRLADASGLYLEVLGLPATET